MKQQYLVAISVWAAAFLVGGELYLLAPENQKDKIKAIYTASTNERQCFNFHKDQLKDPDSAYPESNYVWTKEDEATYNKYSPNPVFEKYSAILRVKIRARNGSGAYVSDYFECPLVDNKFDKAAAITYQTEKEHT